MFKLTRLLLLFIISITLTSCSEEDNESNLVSIQAPTPFVGLVDRELALPVGLEIISLSLSAPWTVLNFVSINNSSRLITVIGSTFIVTDPLSGNRKVITLDFLDTNDFNYLGVIFPSRDTNCDGFVDEAEQTANESPEVPCTSIIAPDPTDADNIVETPVTIFDSRTFYLSGMADAGNGASGSDIEISVSQLYRGLSFPVEGQLEGWFGTPTAPERNFFKQFFFTTVAN